IFIALFFTGDNPQLQFYIKLSIIVLAVLAVVYSYFYYRKFLFYIDYEADKFVLKKGVFSTDDIRIPFDKIQQVDLKQLLLQRLVGTYSLVVDTAGGKGKEVHIHAIADKEAKLLASLLTRMSDAPIEQAKPEESTETKQPHDAVQWVHKLRFI